MKKITILIVLFLLVGAGLAQAARPRLIISGFGARDGPAVVGSSFMLAVNVTNLESTCAEATTMTAEPNAPFILQGVSTTAPITICAGETKTIFIPLRIDPSGTAGSYSLSLALAYEDFLSTTYTESETITLLVEGAPELRASIVKSNPVDVYAGDSATITVRLQNDGTFEAQAIHALLSVSSPLEAKWAGKEMSVGKLAARTSVTADFSIEVPKDAQAKDYPVTLTVQYLDQDRNQKTTTFTFPLTVKKKAAFATTDAGSDGFFANGDRKTVRISLKNTGTDAARKLKVRIQPQYPFTTDGSVRYVDLLDEGSSAPVEFTVDVDKDAAVGTYGLDLVLNFEDDQGNLLQDTAKVALTVKSKDVFRAVFIDYWYLWCVALLIVVIIVRKKMRKTK